MLDQFYCPACGAPWVRHFGKKLTWLVCFDCPYRTVPVPANDDSVYTPDRLKAAKKVAGGSS